MKAYIYNDKIYCEEDLSERADELGHKYGGDFFDLLWELDHNDQRIYHESTTVVRYVGDDFLGTDDDYDDEETLDAINDMGFENFKKIEVEV